MFGLFQPFAFNYMRACMHAFLSIISLVAVDYITYLFNAQIVLFCGTRGDLICFVKHKLNTNDAENRRFWANL